MRPPLGTAAARSLAARASRASRDGAGMRRLAATLATSSSRARWSAGVSEPGWLAGVAAARPVGALYAVAALAPGR